MTDQNESTLKLSNLVAGLYTFKVAVSGDGAYGETFANLTVLPRKYIVWWKLQNSVGALQVLSFFKGRGEGHS